jgi:Fic family protein
VAELALARLSGVGGLVPSVEWLLYSALRKEALLTSQIEGTQASLADLFDDEAGLAVSNGADVEEVSNYLRAFRLVRDQLHAPKGLPISVRLLREAHRLLLDGARGAGKQPGELRRSQNWIGGTRPGNAVFVPPPPEQVPALLAELERFIHQPPEPPLPALVRVALVHAQFETIHPFLDGNGRIGRAIAEKALSQAIGQPSLIALSQTIQRRRSAYYDALEAANKANEVTDWLVYFAETVLEAQTHSLALIDFLLEKTRFHDRFRGKLNARQEKVVARMFREGLDGFKGGLSAANYITIADTSRATATRDLQELVALGAMGQTGTLRYARYHLILNPAAGTGPSVNQA